MVGLIKIAGKLFFGGFILFYLFPWDFFYKRADLHYLRLLLRDIQLLLSQWGYWGPPIHNGIWEPVAGPGESPMPAKIGQ